MDKTKLALGVALVAMVIAIGGYFFPQIKGSVLSFAGVTNYDEVDVDALRVGGTNSSRVDLIATGTCNLSQSTAGSHAATTSKEYFCGVTGVASGDTVIITLPAGAGDYSSGSESISGGFVVNSAFSTTSNVIGVSILNMTGGATSSAAQATTSVVYTVFSTRSTVPGL